MCCFSSRTQVSDTAIFARFVRPGVQGLAYQMQYEAKSPTAMILPLPVALPAREASVRFVSLEGYDAFFDDMARGFPVFSRSRSNGEPNAQAVAVAAAAPLAVHEVGAFIATFVPTIGDFDRVDPRFAIADDVWDDIPAYQDYGFAVFQLKKLAGKPHPIALEMETRMRDALFFPTVHIHDGTVHERDEFHHVLYAQDPRLDVGVGDYAGDDHVEASTGLVRSIDEAHVFVEGARSAGLVESDLLVHRSTLQGLLPNRDTTVRLAGPAVVPATAAIHEHPAQATSTAPVTAP